MISLNSTPEQREEVLKRTMHGTAIASNSKLSRGTSNGRSFYHRESFNIDQTSEHFDALDLDSLVVSSDDDDNAHRRNTPVIGSVHSLETFSSNDGPGIRTLVFLQGCSKRCKFCSNPETQCVIDPFQFPEVAVSDEQVGHILNRYKHYLQPNNGGITLSGGEALLQPDFVRSVFKRAKELSLTTCLDTSGPGSKSIWSKVLPVTDYVMLCIKGMDLRLASFISGVSETSNIRAREFALHIRDNYKDIRLSLRWVLLKGMTDTDDEIQALATFAKDLKPVFTHVELLPYHTLGKEKVRSRLFGIVAFFLLESELNGIL